MLNCVIGLALAAVLITVASGGHLGHLHLPASIAAARGHTAGKASPKTPAAATSAQVTKAVSYAGAQLGKPYEWGGTGPAAYDCSGLVMKAWAAAGVRIRRTSQQQWASLPHITRKQLRRGDLVFYHGYLSPGEQPPGHVVLYIGDGKMIEAFAQGVPVRVTALRPGAWGYARVSTSD